MKKNIIFTILIFSFLLFNSCEYFELMSPEDFDEFVSDYTYTLYFDLNYSGATSVAPPSEDHYAGETFKLPDWNESDTQAGQFSFWKIVPNDTSGDEICYYPGGNFTMPEDDVTLYAYWNQS